MRRDVVDNDGTRTDHGFFPDGNKRQNGDIDPDLRSLLYRRASHTLGRERTSGVQVVGDRDARGEEYVIFQGRELGDITIGMYFDTISDAASIVDHGIGPDGKVIANDVFLSDHHIVAGGQMGPDGRPFVDDGSASNLGVRAYGKRAVLYRSARRIAQTDVVIDGCRLFEGYDGIVQGVGSLRS